MMEPLAGIESLEGFRVVSSDGYVGTVAEVVYGIGHRPCALLVRTGLFAKRYLSVAIEDVLGAANDGRVLLARLRQSSAVDDSDAPVTAFLGHASLSPRLVAQAQERDTRFAEDEPDPRDSRLEKLPVFLLALRGIPEHDD